MRIHELQNARALKMDELEKLNTKMTAPDYVEAEADNTTFNALMGEVNGFDEKIKRARLVREMAAKTATPVDAQNGGGSNLPIQLRRPLYTNGLVAFKDYVDDHGVRVRAEEQAYRCGQWLKAVAFQIPEAAEWCKSNGIPILRAQSEGVNSAGGFLVPEEMMSSIIVLREAYGVLRQVAQIVPMGRDTLNWPRRTGGTTAYFIGEGTAPTQSSVTWDNVNLTAKKAGQLVLLSTEVAEDAIINITDFVVGEIAYAFAALEDNCWVNGDGTSTYGGITGLKAKAIQTACAGSKYTAASGHNTFATLDATDITGMMGLLPQYALPGAAFYMSQVAFATTFERLIASAGGNSVNTLNGEIVYKYLGFPIRISQQMPTSQSSLAATYMFSFGDMKRAVAMGERRQVTIKRSDDRYFDTDQIGLLGTERFDINCHDVGGASGSPGPVVAMVAP